MLAYLIAAAALADASSSSSISLSDTDMETIVVEGRRSGDWVMPKLDYDEPASCPVLIETQIPGFGVMRIKKRCAGDQAEQWRLYQN